MHPWLDKLHLLSVSKYKESEGDQRAHTTKKNLKEIPAFQFNLFIRAAILGLLRITANFPRGQDGKGNK